MIEAIAVFLALCIAYALSAYMGTHSPKQLSRDEIKRLVERAGYGHKARKALRQLHVRATVEQLRKECGL